MARRRGASQYLYAKAEAMTDQFRITIAQLNPTVGDLQGNAAKAKQAWLQGAEQGSDFVHCLKCSSLGITPKIW